MKVKTQHIVFGFPLLAGLLIILSCAILARGQGNAAGGNPPSEIRRSGSRATFDSGGNLFFDLATGKVLRVKNTCSGAAVSASGEASVCYDNTAGAIKLSVSGAAYSSILTAATETVTTPGGSPGQLQYNSLGSFGGISAATSTGNSISIQDGGLFIVGDGNATKKLQFEVDGIMAGVTRILTPPNFNGTIATLAGTETFSNKTLTHATVTGGLQYATGTRPTCDVTARGTIWYVAGGAGVADTYEICRKDAANAYAWITLF